MKFNRSLVSTLALFSMVFAHASVIPGGGGVVIGSNDLDFVGVSGGFQTKAGFSEYGAQEASGATAFDDAEVSAYAKMPEGIFEGTATALDAGVSNITARFRTSTVVKGGMPEGASASLHIDLDPILSAGLSGGSAANNFVRLSFRIYAPDYIKYVEIQVGEGFDSAGSYCSNESASVAYTLWCVNPNEGRKSFELPFAFPSAESRLALEGDFWFQVVNGFTLGFDKGVHMSLELPQGATTMPGYSFIPTSTIPELSSRQMMVLAIPGFFLSFARRGTRSSR